MEFFLGQIIMFGGNFAIRGFMLAQGQLLPISSNSALFSLYGTTYGGDGRTTFGLPDLRGRAPIQQGHGPGLPDYRLGERGGYPTTTLNTTHLPNHSHAIPATNANVNVGIGWNTEGGEGSGNVLANPAINGEDAEQNIQATGQVAIPAQNTTAVGGQQAFSNMQPFLAINYEVCMQGIFPSRS